MEEELFKLFQSYIEESKNDKKLFNGREIILDKDFGLVLFKLMELMVKYSKRSCLRRFHIYEYGYPTKGDIACYDFEEKKLELYIEGVKKYINTALKHSGYSKLDWYKMLYNEIFHSVIHEREHSEQYALMLSLFGKSLEKSILEYTNIGGPRSKLRLAKRCLKSEGIKLTRKNVNSRYNEILLASKQVYEDNYDIDPMERLAEIRTYEIMRQMYMDHEGYEFLCSLSEFFGKESYLTGYRLSKGIVEAPTIVFMEHVSSEVRHDDIPFDWYDEDRAKCLEAVVKEFSFEERFLYGLPITNEEFLRQEQDVKKFKKKFEKFYGCKWKRRK